MRIPKLFNKKKTAEVVIIYNYKQGDTVPKNVTKVIFDASVTEIPDGTYPEGVFSHCTNLKEVIFNDGLQKIGEWAFSQCKLLTIIKLPSTVTEIGRSAFSDCKQLNEVELNEGLQKIGRSAFYECTSLNVIKLPSTVTEAGDHAFYGCTNLREVILNEGLERIGMSAFCKCKSLPIIRLPSTVTKVGNHAFCDCIDLKEVLMNDGLKEIGDGAFANCSSLEFIKFPSTVTKVGPYAFARCTNLREVILNEDLQKITIKIRYGAFEECQSLEYVKFPSISNRVIMLIGAGQTEVKDKITIYEHLEWRGDEFLVSTEAIGNWNWKATRTNLDRALSWVSYYELREATPIIALAFWKMKIEETGAATVEERDACRGEIPGPAKEAIIQYLRVDIVEDGNESDDTSQYSGSSREAESGDY